MDLQLLKLRKTYKNVSLSYINLQTQASFLSACLHNNLTPRGFRIRMRCKTPKKDRSNIEDIFHEHLKEAEDGFTTIFRDHLQFVAAKLITELQDTLREMSSTTNLPTTSELLSHQRFQSATERNVEEAKWRCHLAQRNLEDQPSE